ncbi:XRN 5'-3' exonuclease N-terminus-domain-containing protein [Phakopsora pachyrhizi]|nr:XRN 5'-3' exonuclease N-terminus-domain-containing protein [Phakopsora pachyrhizi]
MGVPALLRWLSRKYPRIVEQAVEDEPIGSQVEGDNISHEDSSDSLYLDMNGIIHCCTHPKGKIPPETEQEMIIKINQQQSCWLRAAQEANSKQLENLSVIHNNRIWDSNAITPGTSFMKLLTGSLRYWNVHKLNIDLGWKQIQVILSDASVPGEGEHKIMKFICRSKTQPSYNCNTRHVIYGLDTDLIMLSLENHEPHFKVLREDFFSDERRRKGCHLCRHPGHHSSQCQGKPKERVNEFDPFIFLNVSTLREYLAIDLNVVGTSFKFELKCAINNWVLLIFFVVNDFLPHLPSLEIKEGAIDCLLKIWKTNLARMGGYLTDCGQLSLSHTEIILEDLAAWEEEIFRKL